MSPFLEGRIIHTQTVTNNLRRTMPRSSIQWLRRFEFHVIRRLIIWIYGLKEYDKYFVTFFNRVEKYYISQLEGRKNNRFVWTYLKECYTICISVLYSETNYIPKCRVSVDKSGLPRIIPAPLRVLLKGSHKVLLGVQSVLGLHRILAYKPVADIGTITEPFNGISRTVSISKLSNALDKLLILAGIPMNKRFNFKLNIPVIRGKLLVKSGPNGPKAFTKVFVDAFALTRDFKLLLTLIKWYSKYGGKRYIVSLLLILFIGFPFWILPYFRDNLHLGRLGVVYNVSGKARVVAMTNWWIQIGLYPLHKAIFDFLKLLPTDGTFDQHKPIRRLCELKVGSKFYSLDLSAATDRLPIDLQVQILSLLIGKESATMWQTLLSVPYRYDPDSKAILKHMLPDGFDIRYSVGQPMGAYSSWAMLALTHHIIVMLASHEEVFSNYAVLGDDVVIQGYDVSQEYLRVMAYLGVEISIPKSMISNNHLEFAKRVFTKDGLTVSIISPGLLLAVARNRLLVGMVVYEAFVRKLFTYKDFGMIIQSIPGYNSKLAGVGLWSLFGVRGLVTDNQLIALKWGVSWLVTCTKLPSAAVQQRFNALFSYPLKESLLKLFDERVEAARAANYKAFKSSYKWFSPFKYEFYNDTLFFSLIFDDGFNPMVVRLLKRLFVLGTYTIGYLLALVSPIPWLILDDLIISSGTVPDEGMRRGKYSLDNAQNIAAHIRELDISSIDNIAKPASVNLFVRNYRKIVDNFIAVQAEIVKDDYIMSALLRNPKSYSLFHENRKDLTP